VRSQGGGQPTDVGVVKISNAEKTKEYEIKILMVKSCKLTGNVIHCGKIENNVEEVEAFIQD